MTKKETIFRRYGVTEIPSGTKWCNKCKRFVNIKDFYKSRQPNPLLYAYCKSCSRIRSNSSKYRPLKLRYYYKNKDKYRGYEIANRQKRQQWRIKRLYGLSEDQYNHILGLQNGGCAICHKNPPQNRRLTVDHDHKTGRVRGLLCSGCNKALGTFGDNVDGINKVIVYLQNHVLASMGDTA